MEQITTRDRELVALGAALGSNCVSCVEHRIPEARRAGLSDSEIAEAIRVADQVRQVSAANVLKTAMAVIGQGPDRKSQGVAPSGEKPTPCCAP